MCGRSLPPLSSVEQFEIRWHQTGCFSVHHVSDTRPSIRPYLCFLCCSSANPGPQCDLANGWRQFGSSCYKLHALAWKSWTEARHDCVQDGADLVSITSADEEQFVTGSLDSSHFDLWIGFSTLVRGTWCHTEQLALSFNAGCEFFCASMWRWALSLQKCNKISCQVEAGNEQFTWSDAQTVDYTNWGPNEPAG